MIIDWVQPVQQEPRLLPANQIPWEPEHAQIVPHHLLWHGEQFGVAQPGHGAANFAPNGHQQQQQQLPWVHPDQQFQYNLARISPRTLRRYGISREQWRKRWASAVV